MDILNTEFKRKFSMTMYKDKRILLSKMSFEKDLVNDTRGALYPLISAENGSTDAVKDNVYAAEGGETRRFFSSFFPYATYEMTADVSEGSAGFVLELPCASAALLLKKDRVEFISSAGNKETAMLDKELSAPYTFTVSCRVGAFDIFFRRNGGVVFFKTFKDTGFDASNDHSLFSNGRVLLSAGGGVRVYEVLSYVDNGISTADMRTLRYENGEVMTENGRLYFTASVRMREEMYQGIFSWIPGTAELELTGALFYDSGDRRWCGDVAASVLYHREKKKWLLWVCSFSHGHILGHAEFEGDIRFGVNVVDIELMEKASDSSDITDFVGFYGDEDPDFFYDEEIGKWRMAVCRRDDITKKYRYFFFVSDKPFEGYKYIGRGRAGAETGGSYVRLDSELYFICGNDFNAVSDYRIYHRGGMANAKFDIPDGGFRGWGTVIPVKQGSRTRTYWLTFDRHNGSDAYNWSYGNIYCFEG